MNEASTPYELVRKVLECRKSVLVPSRACGPARMRPRALATSQANGIVS